MARNTENSTNVCFDQEKLQHALDAIQNGARFFATNGVLAPQNCTIIFWQRKKGNMAQKRYSDEDVLKLLRKMNVHLHDSLDVVSACRKIGISDKNYYWRK